MEAKILHCLHAQNMDYARVYASVDSYSVYRQGRRHYELALKILMDRPNNIWTPK
jgi:hypothetical protein